MDCQEQPSEKKSKGQTKTKKNKNTTSEFEKSKIWAILDNEIEPPTIGSTEIECIYESNPDACSECNSQLVIMEDGFPTCSNNECGRLYREVLDYSPEWRFYGADDNSHSDPTRCGMPINPLLQESSYSCKVLCPGKSSYEMHKIRYTECYIKDEPGWRIKYDDYLRNCKWSNDWLFSMLNDYE